MHVTRRNSHETGYRDYQRAGQVDDVKDLDLTLRQRGELENLVKGAHVLRSALV